MRCKTDIVFIKQVCMKVCLNNKMLHIIYIIELKIHEQSN